MRVSKDNVSAVIIDIQDRLAPNVNNHIELIKNMKILVRVLKMLDVPIIVSQQYTKGLGPTVKEIDEVLGTYEAKEKIAFSCWDEPSIQSEIKQLNKKWIIVTGIEAHICVLQTVLDLIDNGYVPVLIEDCISSRKDNDKKIAVERMRKAGAIVTTYESILFELFRYAGTEQFKEFSRLIK